MLNITQEHRHSYEYAFQDDIGRDVSVDHPKDRAGFRIRKWNNEACLSMTYGLEVPAEVVSDSKVCYRGKDEEVHTYPVKDGFELEVVLLKRPKTNRFTFRLDGWENLTLSFQTSLNREYKGKYPYLTETQAFNSEGNLSVHRPEHVIYSYAVYGKHANGKYGTGKVGHLYRPEAIDAKGRRQWCSMRYLGRGELIVTVPWCFLNEARYPVIVDPTLGYTTIGGTSTDAANPFVVATVHQMSEDGTATAFNVYTTPGSGPDSDYVFGIYNSSSSTPSTRVSASASGTVSGGTGWKSRSITGSLTSGNYYGLAVHHNSGAVTALTYSDTTTATRYYASRSYDGTMVDPYASGSGDTVAAHSWYIDYDAAGGATKVKDVIGCGIIPRAR